MTIATIIVNYNAGDMLLRCVSAVLESNEKSTVTVIDNASSDGSAKNLQKKYAGHDRIEIQFNSSNIGFAPAINAAASHLVCNWVLILNPDCILEHETLGRLKNALEHDPHAGIAGPAVRDDDGKIQRATLRRFPDPWKSFVTASGLWRLSKWFPAFNGIEVDTTKSTGETVACDAVSGACMLVRRSAFEAVGFLDEEYAMHCEDLDLMHRLKDHGWHCLYVARASSTHQQGLSSRSRPLWVHFQKHRGMARFFKKFQASTTSFPVRILVYTGIWSRFIILCPLVLIRR